MANLKDNSRVYGSLTVDRALIASAGGGFQNRVVFTSGSSVTYTFPPALQVIGANFKVTLIGGGGSGGGAGAAAGRCGGGGGSGAVIIAYYKVSTFSFVYTVGAAGAGTATGAVGNNGTLTNILYAGGFAIANPGSGASAAESVGIATGGAVFISTSPAPTSSLSFVGNSGGSSGIKSTSNPANGLGGSTPLGFGQGGLSGSWGGSGTDPRIATGYGAGGAGGFSTSSIATAGSAGSPGVIILEY